MSRVVRPASAFTTLRPRTKLQRERAAASERVLQRAREDVVVRDDRHCGRCGDWGVEVHHRMNRGSGGSNARPEVTHARSRLVLLCRDCHRWVGWNPREAEIVGLLVRRGVIACERVPLLYRGRWVLLTDDCQITDIEGTS